MARRGNSVVTEWLATGGVALVALVSSACPKPALEVEDAGSGAVAVETVADASWALTAGQLDAWLRFQQARIAALSQDGGAALGVQDRAMLESRLVREAGLDFEAVDRVEEIVAAVVTARLVERLTGEDAAKELERSAAGLSGEQKTQVEEAAAALRERLAASDPLAAERAAFGEAAVALVLAREAEAEATWNALLELKGPEARTPRPRNVADGGGGENGPGDGGADAGASDDGAVGGGATDGGLAGGGSAGGGSSDGGSSDGGSTSGGAARDAGGGSGTASGGSDAGRRSSDAGVPG